MQTEVNQLIELFHLRPLPVEGTLFARTYRSPQDWSEGKPFSTGMVGLYCTEPESISLFHKLSVDEMWHFYSGDPLRLVLLYPDGSSEDVTMGNDPLKGQRVQFVIPAGVWQAGHMMDGGKYSLYGCTLAPGFCSEIFTLGERKALLTQYPEREGDIIRLTIETGETVMPQSIDLWDSKVI